MSEERCNGHTPKTDPVWMTGYICGAICCVLLVVLMLGVVVWVWRNALGW